MFEKRLWFYRDTVMGFSPAEIVGTVAVLAAVLLGLRAIFGTY